MMNRLLDRQKERMRLLIVDDDEVDVLGMQRTLRAMQVDADVTVAHDGMEALALLRSKEAEHGMQPPFLIVLDLNMPRMTGFEFLEELRRDQKLMRSIVFVLSTSTTASDIQRAYANNVAAYIKKSTGGESIRRTIDLLTRYWSAVELP